MCEFDAWKYIVTFYVIYSRTTNNLKDENSWPQGALSGRAGAVLSASVSDESRKLFVVSETSENGRRQQL